MGEHYFIICLRYIETNPARADLVKTPEFYQWSSYSYSALGINNPLLNVDPWFTTLGNSVAKCRLIYARFIKESIEENELDQLRKVTHKGGVFADKQFKDYTKNAIRNTTINHLS